LRGYVGWGCKHPNYVEEVYTLYSELLSEGDTGDSVPGGEDSLILGCDGVKDLPECRLRKGCYVHDGFFSDKCKSCDNLEKCGDIKDSFKCGGATCDVLSGLNCEWIDAFGQCINTQIVSSEEEVQEDFSGFIDKEMKIELNIQSRIDDFYEWKGGRWSKYQNGVLPWQDPRQVKDLGSGFEVGIREIYEEILFEVKSGTVIRNIDFTCDGNTFEDEVVVDTFKDYNSFVWRLFEVCGG